MPEAPLLSVVIVTYNSPDWTRRCLDALLGDGAPTWPYEVVVVDSGSGEPTTDLLRGYADRVRLVLSAENIGFARGCDLGVEHSRGELVLLLNPDAVVAPGSVDALVAFLAEHPGAGLVGGRTLRPDGTVDPSSCWGRPTLWSLTCFALGLSTVFRRSALFDPESLGRWDRDSVRQVDVVTGCLLLTRRETWDRLGGLDRRFFMYGEDADLALRARAAGFRPMITPAAVAVHAVGASSAARADKHVLVLTGKATLARKHRRGLSRALAIRLLELGVGLRSLPEVARPAASRRWLPAWRSRSDWRQGFPPADPAPPAVTVLDERPGRHRPGTAPVGG